MRLAAILVAVLLSGCMIPITDHADLLIVDRHITVVDGPDDDFASTLGKHCGDLHGDPERWKRTAWGDAPLWVDALIVERYHYSGMPIASLGDEPVEHVGREATLMGGLQGAPAIGEVSMGKDIRFDGEAVADGESVTRSYVWDGYTIEETLTFHHYPDATLHTQRGEGCA